jgi:hypothetical protein
MVRALVTLLGAAGALALLYLAPDGGRRARQRALGVAFAIAGAGFALGLLYQGGGIRKPGVRHERLAAPARGGPWTLLALGIVAQSADVGSNIAGWTPRRRPGDVLERWVDGDAAFALGSGLLLALGPARATGRSAGAVEPVFRARSAAPANRRRPDRHAGVDETSDPSRTCPARPTAWQSDVRTPIPP